MSGPFTLHLLKEQVYQAMKDYYPNMCPSLMLLNFNIGFKKLEEGCPKCTGLLVLPLNPCPFPLFSLPSLFITLLFSTNPFSPQLESSWSALDPIFLSLATSNRNKRQMLYIPTTQKISHLYNLNAYDLSILYCFILNHGWQLSS